jgi:hypothetical protein
MEIKQAKLSSRDCVAYKIDMSLLQGSTKDINWELVERFEPRIIPLEQMWQVNYTTGRWLKTADSTKVKKNKYNKAQSE